MYVVILLDLGISSRNALVRFTHTFLFLATGTCLFNRISVQTKQKRTSMKVGKIRVDNAHWLSLIVSNGTTPRGIPNSRAFI